MSSLISIADWLLITATITGPILAVQAQKVVENLTQTRRRKLHLFAVLMANRASPVSADRVQALNMIDIEFSGSSILGLFRHQSKKEKRVIDEWRIYLDILNEDIQKASENVQRDWIVRRDNQSIELLYVLSKALGFDFDKVHLKRSIYSPFAHSEAEAVQMTIRDGLAKIFSGERPIPMAITHFPFSEEAFCKRKCRLRCFLR